VCIICIQVVGSNVFVTVCS